MNFYPPMGRKNMAVNSTFKGLSTLDPYQIAESFATVAKNLDGDGYPAMKARSPLCLVGTEVAYGNTTGIQGIFRYKRNGVTELIVAAAGRLYKQNGGSWTELVNMSGLPTFPTSPIATNDIYAANFVQGMVFSTGASPVMYLYDGTSVSSFTPGISSNVSPPFPQYVTEHENRLFASVGNLLRCSVFRVYNDWTNVDETAIIYTDEKDGEEINGLLSGNSRLLVFKPNNMYELYGVDKLDFRLVKVTDRLGAVNGKCAVNLDGVTYFMHTTGVYAYAGGRPKRISDTVGAYFNGWTDTRKKQAFVGTDGTRLFCHVGDDRMLVWHSEFNVWYEWTNFQARCMMSEPSPLFGTTTDKIKAFEGVALESNVAWEWVSKPINTGVLAQKWRMNRLWLTLDTGLATSINVYVSKTADGSDWTLLRTITGSAQQQNVRVSVNTGTAANAKVIRIKLTGSGTCTVHELVRESRIFPLV